MKILIRVYRYTQPRFTCGVSGVYLNDHGEVLLVEHVFHPEYPWGLPGGWIDRGESPAHAAEREFMEEVGLDVTAEPRPLLMMLEPDFGAHIDIAYRMRGIVPADPLEVSDELLSYAWYALEDLPKLRFFQRIAIEIALKDDD